MARFEENVVAAGGAAGAERRRKVMVVVDESESSYRTLMWALDNLEGNMKEVVIFMAQPPQQCYPVAAPFSSALMFYPASGTPEFVRYVQEQQRKLTLALLDKAKKVCANQGVVAETITEVGDPKEAICGAVEKFNISLLVMGEHDLGKIKRALVGSVSNYCVQNAKCPVLVVKKSQCA